MTLVTLPDRVAIICARSSAHRGQAFAVRRFGREVYVCSCCGERVNGLVTMHTERRRLAVV